MAESKRLAAHRASVSVAQAASEDDAPLTPVIPVDEPTTSNPNPKGNTMDEAAQAAAIAQAKTDATAAANARFGAVMASEHYAAQPALAKTLLATDLSAEQIVTALADATPPAAAPAIDPAAATAAAEASGRAAMLAAINEGGNSDIDAGGADAKPNAEDVTAIWGRAVAKVCPK